MLFYHVVFYIKNPYFFLDSFPLGLRTLVFHPPPCTTTLGRWRTRVCKDGCSRAPERHRLRFARACRLREWGWWGAGPAWLWWACGVGFLFWRGIAECALAPRWICRVLCSESAAAMATTCGTICGCFCAGRVTACGAMAAHLDVLAQTFLFF